MKPFAWVLFSRDGYAMNVIPDVEDHTLESAWCMFSELGDFKSVAEMQEMGYRVLRCKLVEVGPA